MSRKTQTIDVTKLSLLQLTEFKNQMDKELQFYQESLQSLKHAQTKFQESGECLSNFTSENKDKEILMPLSGSMYVFGKLSDTEKVIIEIGTGYYVEKDIASSKEFFTKKVKFVTEQIERVQSIGNEKNDIREAVMDVMQSKLRAQLGQLPTPPVAGQAPKA